MTTTFSPKGPSEAIYYGIDFADLLADAETISSATTGIRALRAEHANVNAMLSGTAVISGSIVKQKVTGGNAGNEYRLGITIVTNAGQTFVESGDIEVVERD